MSAAGFVFDVHAVEIDETPRPGEPAAGYVERLAIEKAQAAFKELIDKPKGLSPQEGLSPKVLFVLGADTTVVLDGRILGKPEDRADAIAMLKALSGRAHDVITGVAIVSAAGVRSGVEHTRVWFAAVTDEDIRQYVDSGQPMDKAGAYGIQGLASRFIPRIEGSYTNVVGLPVTLVSSILRGE
ncbi:MAG: Maf family protein [Acidobacteriota bacterium]|nr:Maf family protein [Acidobacteriota bacterium]